MEELRGEGKKEEVCLKAREKLIVRNREWREWKRSERGDGYGR